MTKNWEITTFKKITPKNPICIEGLPGIGNVGKIAIDILIDEVKAEKVLSLFSYNLPNSVFVNENNLVDLPTIELYYKKIGGKDFLFLAGDVQPSSELASYEFTEELLNILERYKTSFIVTLGGIGLGEIPPHPQVFCTGNSKTAVKQFSGMGVQNNIYGVVGPIVGISGLLLGLAGRRKIDAAALLSETFGHPVYIGLPGAKELLNVLCKKYGFSVSLKELDEEIKELEKNITPAPKKLGQKHIAKYMKYRDINYIG